MDDLFARFDPNELGNPELSYRDGYYYIMDGQHRIEAVKLFLGGDWDKYNISCWVSHGLTEQEEAEVFLRLQDRLAVDLFQKFQVGKRAGRPDENAIAKIVEDLGLKISKQKIPSSIRAVGILMRVYRRSGGDVLSRSLKIIRDSYGDSGYDANVIEGVAWLCHRYNGLLNETAAIKALGDIHGGVNGLLGSAIRLQDRIGGNKSLCVAATAVDIINRKSDKKNKLPSWWKS